MEKLEKNFERISSHHWSDMSNVPYKVRINRINIFRALLLLSMPKKVKETMRTRMSGNKITWTETFVGPKKTCQMKNHLKPKDFSLLWKLANKYPPYKKNVQSFLNVTVTPLFSNSIASGVYTVILQITQKILITDTCHWLEPITVILGFLKIFTFSETITHFRTILFFSKSKVPIFKSNFR